MESIRDVIEEYEDLPLVLDCLEREIRRCRAIADRPMQGYGSASEKAKKEAWAEKADKLDELRTNISYAYL